SVAAALAIGIAIDRWSARQMTPFFLLPMAVGFFVFALADSPAAGQLAMILFGLTAGSGLTLLSALWAELYGTRHLGAIRALGQASSVFATAIGPGIMGLLLDRGVGLEQQFYVMGACSIVAALAFLPLMPRMRRAMQPL
ncbi:MAG: MFS transporter, partial [Hyphomicrobiaceae bacterium]